MNPAPKHGIIVTRPRDGGGEGGGGRGGGLTRLGREVTVDRVAWLLVGEVLHGLKGRRTCWREKKKNPIRSLTPKTGGTFVLIPLIS